MAGRSSASGGSTGRSRARTLARARGRARRRPEPAHIRVATRRLGVRRPSTSGTDRSAPIASSHGASITRASARRTRAGTSGDAGREVVAQRECLQRGDGHALPVDRVEAADRVADDEEAVREASHPLVAAPDVRLESVRRRAVDRLGGADRVVEVGEAQRSGEGVEAVTVLGGVIAEQSRTGSASTHRPRAWRARRRAAGRVSGRAGRPGRRARLSGGSR